MNACTTCGHDVDDHGDGVVHTACCHIREYEGNTFMCPCTEYQEV